MVACALARQGRNKKLAGELIKLYAERARIPGHAFAPDSPWQREFEDNFGYTETDDQLRSINEIKADMESETPMDRLLCGDVGYGKTEVALRAAMKCILDNRQAAILVPTTVLAQQHYQTAVQRFFGFPITVEVLSRFRTPAQIQKRSTTLKPASATSSSALTGFCKRTSNSKASGFLSLTRSSASASATRST